MAVTYTESITGRSGTITIGGVPLGITGWTATVTREYADSTDSNNFDPATSQTWTTNAAGVVGMELTIEGNYDVAGTTDTNVTQKFLSDPPTGGWPTTLSMVRTDVWCTLGIVLTSCEFTVTVPGATMVTFSVSGKSQGIASFTGLAPTPTPTPTPTGTVTAAAGTAAAGTAPAGGATAPTGGATAPAAAA